jgi:hypothetical protein
MRSRFKLFGLPNVASYFPQSTNISNSDDGRDISPFGDMIGEAEELRDQECDKQIPVWAPI